MLFLGAGGMAAQLFDDLITLKVNDYVFWSETATEYNCIKENFKILQTDIEVKNYFAQTSKLFSAAIWDIDDRKKLIDKFKNLGGQPASFISPYAHLSLYTTVETGAVVLNQVASEPGVNIGENCVINKRANFGHGAVVARYCSVGPYTIIASDAAIGENCYIGMGAIIQPKVKLGKNVIVAAGTVVSKNIPDNAVVSGVPAKIRFFRKL
jgi:sugar O-acyltransferase (sialic acid O-acetyltransferase NeuD family)